VSHVVVLPTGIQADSVRTRMTTLVACAEPTRTDLLESVMVTLGSDTHILGSAAEIRDYADRHAPPDACVIVTPLPDGPVLPLLRMLRARGWQRVEVLSSRADARAVYAALLSGARCVLIQAATDQPPRPAIQPNSSVRLSERELEVLRLVADGQTNRVVGQRLGLSGLTVKSHLARIARKLGSGDRAQMVATAIRSGYIH